MNALLDQWTDLDKVELLNIKDLSVSFKTETGEFKAVNAINLSIQKKQILALIGESGSGKSVASQSITKLIHGANVQGSIFYSTAIKQVDLVTISEKELQQIRKREIAYIFQEPMTALNPLIRCADQIAECLPTLKNQADQLKSLMHKVELSDAERVLNAFPHELSGGQRQRVMIAMALAKQPKLLIADEPTTALDIAVQNEILDLLKQLVESEDLSILFITHDLLSLKNFAHKIAVMYKGEIVEFNDAKTVLNSPQHPYTKALIESRATYKKRGYYLSEINELLKIENHKLHFVEGSRIPLAAEPNSNHCIIKLQAVYKWHEKRNLFKTERTEVLKSIDFELFEGDSLGLIGESGSGKSTIAKLILKIWHSNKGTIEVYGEPLDHIKRLQDQIQLVFQDPYSSLNPKHRIGSAIAEVLASSRQKANKEDVEALLETVGLSKDAYSKFPHEFSGGQRQRICIAKALAKNPKIIVLDEAVSALDVSVQARILNLLNRLKQQKKLSYILISHDMNVVSYFCNRILVLKEGVIQDYGLTEHLIASPRSNYTQSLLQHSIY